MTIANGCFRAFLLLVPGVAGLAQTVPSICDAIPGNLIQNCGFEQYQANYSYFITPGAGGFYFAYGNHVNSGAQALVYDAAAFGKYVGLQQTVTTTPGQPYILTFYLSPGGTPRDFQVLLNGITIFDDPEPGTGVYAAHSVLVFGTGSDTFTFQSYEPKGTHDYLDDISLVPAPPPLNAAGTGVEDAFQVNYASQLNQGDSVINIVNAGTSIPSEEIADVRSFAAPGTGAGNICVNIYVFNPDEELETCCSCPLTPNELISFAYIGSINGAPGLLSNTANPSKTSFISAVTKLVSTLGSTCNNVAPSAGPNGRPGNVTAAVPITPATLAAGLTAWSTHSHPTNGLANLNGTLPVNITERKFVQKGLSQGEANFLANTCAAFVQNSSGAGICSCPSLDGGFARQ